MMILHSATTAHAATAQREIQNDPYALAIVLVIIVLFAIMVLRKSILAKKQTAQAEPAAEPVKQAAPATAPGSAGEVKLYNVEPRTAAMLMAIVADRLGKPLNELRFVSIKEVE